MRPSYLDCSSQTLRQRGDEAREALGVPADYEVDLVWTAKDGSKTSILSEDAG